MGLEEGIAVEEAHHVLVSFFLLLSGFLLFDSPLEIVESDQAKRDADAAKEEAEELILAGQDVVAKVGAGGGESNDAFSKEMMGEVFHGWRLCW
jgi:hypothetical protein